MKNIYEILAEYDLKIPEDKKKEFDKTWKENYRTKAEYDNAVRQRDGYKSDLDDVNKKLDAFKDVDVADLQNQISTLKDDLKKKDEDYAAKEADRVFMDVLKESIKTAGGRNEKAVMALLDIDTLKESKNQGEDIKKALDAAKESDAYLFGKDEPINNAVGSTQNTGGVDATTAAMRAAAGLPPAK